MTKDEALKLALDALENSVDLVREDACQAQKLYGNYPIRQGKVNGLKVLADDHEKAITAIKKALAQQEPYLSEAIRYSNDRMKIDPVTGNVSIGTPQRKPLSDEEIWNNDKIMAANSGYGATFDTLRELIQAIEAAHNIKGEA